MASLKCGEINVMNPALSLRNLPSKVMEWKRPPSTIVLRSCLADTYSGFQYARKLVKLTAWSYINFSSSKRWMAHWNSSHFLKLLAQSTPCVLQKIYRPYLTNRFSCSDRLDGLIGHYAFIIKQGLGPLILRAAQSPVLLGEIAGKSDEVYQIHLAAVRVLDREGEMVLELSKDGVLLYSVAFTFFRHVEVMSLGIGCVQGPCATDALDRIRKATRDLYGMRPKNLLLQLVRQIAYRFGCQDILLVGNKNRVASHQIKRGKVFADYDSLWQEIGAVRGLDGDFKLACAAMPLPDFDAIPSRKRSEARKRFALTEQAIDAVWAGLWQPQFSLVHTAPTATKVIKEGLHFSPLFGVQP